MYRIKEAFDLLAQAEVNGKKYISLNNIRHLPLPTNNDHHYDDVSASSVETPIRGARGTKNTFWNTKNGEQFKFFLCVNDHFYHRLQTQQVK